MIRSVVFCSTGFVHPGLLARERAYSALRFAATRAGGGPGAEEPAVRHWRGLRGLSRALVSDADLVVVYIHRRRCSEGIVERAERYVERGGRLLALHAATASFRGSERWSRLLGGRFVDHGPVGRRVLSREPAVAGPSERLPPRIELCDEAYRHERPVPIDVWYRWDDDEPAAWTRGGAGAAPTVAYLAAGHRGRVWAHPGVRAVLSEMVDALYRSAAEGRAVSV